MLTADSNGIFTISTRRSAQPALYQRITLADPSAAALFVIGRPLRIVAPAHQLRELEGGTLHWESSWRHPVRYDVFSDLSPAADAQPLPLVLPSVSLGRVRNLTDRIAGRGPALEQAKAIEAYLQKNYRYSTDFGDRVPENPVDYFLFERRQGSCGHFASAMAVMLRLRGISSRVVAGYRQGEWNGPAQAIVVRERDAHAWVEAFIQGQGWMTFDPTPVHNATGMLHSTFFTRLREYDDYFSLLWSQFVIQYDLYTQIRAYENLRGVSSRLASAWTVRWPQVRYSFRRPKAALRIPLIGPGLLLALSVMGLYSCPENPAWPAIRQSASIPFSSSAWPARATRNSLPKPAVNLPRASPRHSPRNNPPSRTSPTATTASASPADDKGPTKNLGLKDGKIRPFDGYHASRKHPRIDERSNTLCRNSSFVSSLYFWFPR